MKWLSLSLDEAGYVTGNVLLSKNPEKAAETPLYLASSPEVETINGHYFVNRVARKSSARSYDESLQRQLWVESTRLVRLPAPI
jgi:hypothetical protein